MYITDFYKEAKAFTYEENYDIAKSLTVGVSCTAKYAFFPKSEGELKDIIRLLYRYGVKFILLGMGSNCTPRNDFFNGAVIFTKRIKKISFKEGVLTAQCGASVKEVLNFSKEIGVSSLEFMSGIPSRIGGAIYMNAGIKEGYIADKIKGVYAFDGSKEVYLSNEECRFSYKDSVFQRERLYILRAELYVKEMKREDIDALVNYYVNKRERLPKGKSFGCTFKNPIGVTAGELIDGCSLKGLSVGGAKISEEHANFIINFNEASCEDIISLISAVKNAVKEKTGIELEEEIRYI